MNSNMADLPPFGLPPALASIPWTLQFEASWRRMYVGLSSKFRFTLSCNHDSVVRHGHGIHCQELPICSLVCKGYNFS
uniref:Uncharacterized protein n=1 Tax=Lepeophtheirus salmonis TaxID=72036 RepID=A0A0K2SZ72_LEPSM